MICSIYKITNSVNSKIYVGQTWSTIQHRLSQHCSDKRRTHLHNSIAKYGKDKFSIQLITITHSQTIADYWEAHFMSKFDSIENGYNTKEAGSTGRHSEETKKKISIANTGNQYGIGNKGNRSGLGRKLSKEHIEKLSKPRKLTSKQILAIQNDSRPYSDSMQIEYGIKRTHYYRIKASNSNKKLKRANARNRFTNEQIVTIQNDIRSYNVICKEYDITTSTYYRIRKMK